MRDQNIIEKNPIETGTTSLKQSGRYFYRLESFKL